MQFIDKAVDTPVVPQRLILMNRNVQKTTEIPKLQYTDDVVGVPVVLVVQAPLVQVMAKTVEIPQLLSDVQVPQVRIVTETVEIPQSLFVEKTVMIPEIQTVQGPRTSESLSGEITDAWKMDHETVGRGVPQDIQMDSFIDDLSSIASKGLSHHDCGGPSHVDSTSGSMHQQHTPGQAEEERERRRRWKRRRRKGKEREKEDKVKRGRKVEKKERREEMVKEERRRKEGTLSKKSASRLRRT